jgi:hypothetical protein
MPKVAEFVDQVKSVFGDCKVKYASENGIERGTKVSSELYGRTEAGILGYEAGFDWSTYVADIALRERKAQESAKPQILGNRTRYK